MSNILVVEDDRALAQVFQQGLERMGFQDDRRSNDYHTVNNVLAFVPNHRTLEQTNLFVQDNFALTDELKLVAGVKLEDNSYSDWSVLPDLRLSWEPNDTTLFWLAGSKAIRAPTPFDTDVQEFSGGSLFVIGDPGFKPEKVTAYEIGYRGQPATIEHRPTG